MPTQFYVRMKNSNGAAVWRNVAPQFKSNKMTLHTPLQTATRRELLSGFIPIQTEDLYVNSDGRFEVKTISEEVYYVALDPAYIHAESTVPGTDAWADTTDEKYVVSLTDGNVEYGVKLPNAATAVFGTGSLDDAVVRYCTALQTAYVNKDDENVNWTQVDLTGTKDSIVATND